MEQQTVLDVAFPEGAHGHLALVLLLLLPPWLPSLQSSYHLHTVLPSSIARSLLTMQCTAKAMYLPGAARDDGRPAKDDGKHHGRAEHADDPCPDVHTFRR
jgi:hypothetical protein